MPNSIHIYNQHMGGVDLFDQQVAAYRIRIRPKKWWWSLFAWNVNVQVVNAWRVYRNNDNKISLLEFSRQIIIGTLKTYGNDRKQPGPTAMPIGQTLDIVRFNNQHHWTVKGTSRYNRCRVCPSRTIYFCDLCNVPLHPECMKLFHTKE